MPGVLQGVFTFALLVGLCVGFLAVLGLPLRWWLAPGRPDPYLVETTAMGGAVFGAFAWYWCTFGTGGLRRGMPFLGLLLVAAVLVVGVRNRRWRPPGLRRAVAAVAAPLVLLSITIGLFGVHLPGFYTQDELGPVSAGNNDLPFYALNGSFLERHRFDEPSPVTTYDLGGVGRTDVAGGFLFLAGVDAATGLEEWRIAAAVMGLGVFLLLGALAQLMGRFRVGGRGAQTMIAGLAVMSGTFFYNVLHGYVAFALTLGPTVLLLALAIEVAEGGSWQERRLPVVIGALATAWVYVVYPHVAFFFVPLLVATVVAWRLGRSADAREWLCSSIAAGSATMAMLVLPVLLIPDRTVISVGRLFALEATTAGWSVGRVRLAQWLGLAHFPDGATGRGLSLFGSRLEIIVLAAQVVLVVLAAAVVVGALVRALGPSRRRAEWLTLLVMAALPLALYELLHLRYGELYQAWKAMTYVQPLFVAVLLAVAWRLLRMATPGPARRAATAGFAAAAVFAVATIGAAKPHRNVLNLRVTDEHRELKALTGRFGMKDLNIELTDGAPVWDGMWAMYFVGGITFYAQSDTYVAKTAPVSPWTLRSAASVKPPHVTRHDLNRRFVLDHAPVAVEPAAAGSSG